MRCSQQHSPTLAHAAFTRFLLSLAAAWPARVAAGPAAGGCLGPGPPLPGSGQDALAFLQVELRVGDGQQAGPSLESAAELQAARLFHGAVGRYYEALDRLREASEELRHLRPRPRDAQLATGELADITTEMDFLHKRFQDLSRRLPRGAVAPPPLLAEALESPAGSASRHSAPKAAISLFVKNPWQQSGKGEVVNSGYASGLAWHAAQIARQGVTVEAETEDVARVNPWIVLILVVLILLVVGVTTIIASPFSIQEQGRKPEQGARYSFLQVVLPYWVPTTPNSRGCLFALLFLVLFGAAASVMYWCAVLAVYVGHGALPDIVTKGPNYGVYGSHFVRVLTGCIIGFAPLVFLARRRDLKGRWEQWAYLFGRILVMLMLNIWAVATSYIAAKQMDAMVARDRATWWTCTWLVVWGILYTVCCHMANYYLQNYIGMRWRAFLTHHFLDLYMARRSYYNMDPAVLDNPDQRIQEDANKVTVGLLEFSLSLMSSVIGIISFAAVLWSLMPALTVAGVGYAVVGSLLALGITWRLVKLNYVSQRCEADFRFSLVHIRNNTEAIAFYRGEAREKEIAKMRFDGVLGIMYRNISWMSLNRGFTEFYYVFANIFPAFILCGAYFQQKLDMGAFTQATGAFATTVASLSFVVDQIDVVSDLATATNRLGALLMLLKRSEDAPGVKCVNLSEPRIEIRDLTATTPGGARVLVRSLNLAMGGGGKGPARLLVVGNSGVGKSSLLRVLAGLWSNGCGEVARPPNSDCVFMPQRPYMPLGNLRTQLLYPDLTAGDSNQQLDDAELRVLLERVGLGSLPDRFEDGFDAVCDWARVLSLGEQQRVASVRCFLQSPKLTVLDEATSALSESDERRLYEHLWNLRLSYVSVAHRDSLLRFHDAVLELRGGAEWKLYSAEEYKATLAQRRA